MISWRITQIKIKGEMGMRLKYTTLVALLASVLVFMSTNAKDFAQGITKINDGLYVGKKGDLYFALERLTPHNVSFWRMYIDHQEEKAHQEQEAVDEKIQNQSKITRVYDRAKDEYDIAYKKYNNIKEQYDSEIQKHPIVAAYNNILEKFKNSEKNDEQFKHLKESKSKIYETYGYGIEAVHRIMQYDKIKDEYDQAKNILDAASEKLKLSDNRNSEEYKMAKKNVQELIIKKIYLSSLGGATQGFKGIVGFFERYFKPGDPDQVWIAYVTTKKITTESINIPLHTEGDILMALTVSTTPDLLFYSPMGIFRPLEITSSSYKNLSMDLHSFIAKVIKLMYKNKEYMITMPIGKMGEIMAKSVPNDLVWVDDPKKFSYDREKGIMFLLDKKGQSLKFKKPAYWGEAFNFGKSTVVDIDALAALLKLDK